MDIARGLAGVALGMRLACAHDPAPAFAEHASAESAGELLQDRSERPAPGTAHDDRRADQQGATKTPDPPSVRGYLGLELTDDHLGDTDGLRARIAADMLQLRIARHEDVAVKAPPRARLGTRSRCQ